MTRKPLFVAAFAAVLMAVGSVVLLRATFTQATPGTVPVQPFTASVRTGLLSSQLGATAAAGTAGLRYNVDVPTGTRIALPTFYADGFPYTPDMDLPDGMSTGTVSAEADILCNGEVDYLLQKDAPYDPFTFYERTTNVDTDGQLGTDDEDYVRFNSPLWEMIVRQRADLNGVHLGGPPGTWLDLIPPIPLNATTMQVPWKPGTTAGQVSLGGNPGPPSGVCQDTPQNSESTQIGLMDNPPREGDSGHPCTDPTCADKGITMWSAYPASLSAIGLPGFPVTTTVTKKVHNNGPGTGAFTDKWVAELPDVLQNATGRPGPDGIPDVRVQWVAQPGDVCTLFGNIVPCDSPEITDLEVPEPPDLLPSQGRTYTRNINVDCSGSPALLGYRALVALKNILLPIGTTKDQYLENNAATTMIQIDCGDVSGQISVDKSVVWVEPVAVTGFNNAPSEQESTPGHLQLVVPDVVTVTVDEMKVYHPDESDDLTVPGRETLEAEAPWGIGLRWVPEVGDVCTLNGLPVPCGTGEGGGPIDNCEDNIDNDFDGSTDWYDPECAPQVNDLEFTVDEPRGEQIDETRDLLVHCGPAALLLPMPQPVVIKAVDRPMFPFKEDVKHDNVTYDVIKVWCYANPSGILAAMDGIDDGTGLYVRWTAFQSSADIRKSITIATLPPTGSPGDTAYVERKVVPECFWIDEDNSPGHAPPDLNGDGWISADESHLDPDLLAMGGYAAIDADGDCLENAAHAQPSHKVDSRDPPTGTLCPAVVYSNSGSAIQVQYDTAADQDCDGLTDGVENGWGSDPMLADTDGDGASDFLEMFRFTDPGNPDTDNDGIKDKPEDDYVAQPAGGFETNGATFPVPPVNEAVDADDNCSNRYNPGQENNDGKRIANGANIPGAYSSNPNADTQGDACDHDDDNDGMDDVAELNYATQVPNPPGGGATCTLDPLNPDTDSDHARDGIEHQLGSNPCVWGPTAASLTADQARLFRGGGISVPVNGAYGGVWDAENDMTEEVPSREKNADADYSGPPFPGTSVNSFGDGGYDRDNDDGSNGNPAEIADIVEVKGFNTGPSRVDTDGDGCADWIEIADVNGDRIANILDVLQVAQSALGGEVTTEPDRTILDIDKDRALGILDVMVEAMNSTLVKAIYGCPSDTER